MVKEEMKCLKRSMCSWFCWVPIFVLRSLASEFVCVYVCIYVEWVEPPDYTTCASPYHQLNVCSVWMPYLSHFILRLTIWETVTFLQEDTPWHCKGEGGEENMVVILQCSRFSYRSVIFLFMNKHLACDRQGAWKAIWQWACGSIPLCWVAFTWLMPKKVIISCLLWLSQSPCFLRNKDPPVTK